MDDHGPDPQVRLLFASLTESSAPGQETLRPSDTCGMRLARVSA